MECPGCGASFIAEPVLPSKEDTPPPSKEEAEKAPVAEKETPAEEEEIISLEDLEVDDVDIEEDDETAAIKEIDLGDDDAVPAGGENDDTFLEDDDTDGASVSDLISKPATDDEV